MTTVLVSIVCLAIIALVCAAGALYDGFQDNWFEFAGMSALCFWCVSRIGIVWQRDYELPEYLLLYGGLAFFALGAAVKVVRRARLAKLRWPGLPKLDRTGMARARSRGR